MNEFPILSGHAWLAGRGIAHSGLWFRVFGWGVHISSRKRSDALFSERHGHRRALYVFGVRFEGLRP